jgi:hypothetical protein
MFLATWLIQSLAAISCNILSRLDNVVQEILKFLFIPKFYVAFPAQRNQVVYRVGLFSATHAPGFDVVNVNRLRVAYLARDEVGYIVTHAFQICFCVRFDVQSLDFIHMTY